MAKYRIVPSEHTDGDYELWHLEKLNIWNQWVYVKMSRDKEKLKWVAEFLATEPEYLNG